MNDANAELAGILDEQFRVLDSGESKDRLNAAIRIANLHREWLAPLMVPIWAELLSDHDLEIAVQAARWLAVLGPKSEQAVPALTKALLSGRPGGLQSEIIQTFRQIGKAARRAGWALFQVMKDWRGSFRLVPAIALKDIFDLKHVDINDIISYSNYESFIINNNITIYLPEENPIWAEHFDALLATVPKDAPYEEQAQQLERLNHGFRREIAARLQPALNAHLQTMAHGTYGEKKELAGWVNAQLRRFNLAVRGPSGHPAILLTVPGHPPNEEVGRLLLECKPPEGKRVRTQLPPQLPSFELMEASPRREALREWKEKVSRDQGDVSRS